MSLLARNLQLSAVRPLLAINPPVVHPPLVRHQQRKSAAETAGEVARKASEKLGQGFGEETGEKLKDATKRAAGKVGEAIDRMTPEEPGQAAESVRDQFRDAARMTSEFTKETWEMAKDVAGQAMNKMTGGQSSSDEGFGRMRGEDAPMRSGEMGGMKKEGGEPMGWDPKAINDKTGNVKSTLEGRMHEKDNDADARIERPKKQG